MRIGLRFWRLVALALGVLMVAEPGGATRAETPDLHRLFEDQCGACHGHAGDLARDALTVVDGKLQGRHADLRAFLRRHHGPRSDEEVEAFYRMFLRQAEANGAFKERCRMCHRSASGLARNSLIIVDGELRGRYSGNDIRVFLLEHGRLSADEAAFFYDALREIARGRR